MVSRCMRKLGTAALAVACPPAYVAFKNMKSHNYETTFGRIMGTAFWTGVTAFVGFMASGVYEGAYIDNQVHDRNKASYSWVAKDQNLTVTNTKTTNPSSGIILRQCFTPLEVLALDLTGRFPTKDITYVNGTIRKDGLDFEVSAKLPGRRTSDDITAKDLYDNLQGNVVLSKDSYKTLFRQ